MMQGKDQIGWLTRFWRWLFGYKRPPLPIYHPLPKYYLFNETGNILVCTSELRVAEFDKYVKDAFMDVSVFFSAMSKALALHDAEQDEEGGYALYDFDAMEAIFSHSGLFVATNTEQGYLVSRKVGETLGKRFVQTVLGRSFDDRSLSFTRGMFSGMKQLEHTKGNRNQTVRSGHAFFICEMLNGLPTTSVVLVSIERISGEEKRDADRLALSNQEKGIDIFEYGTIQEKGYKGNCKTVRKWLYQKRTYLFVPPNFMKNARRVLDATDLDGYEDLVSALTEHINSATA